MRIDDVVAGGQLGELIRAKRDWEATKLGTPDTWPQSLRTALGIVLSTRFPMVIFWGEHLSVLYNDAYIPIFGAKHPDVLGKTGFEAWGEVWDVIFPMFEMVRRGEATWSEDQHLALHRRGFVEETYHTWSYSPIRDESGSVGGVLTVITETTPRVLAERRLGTLRDLGEQVANVKTVDDACTASVETLTKNSHDVPFAAIYLADDDRFRRAATSLSFEDGASDSADGPWCIGEVTRSGVAKQIERVDVALPGGPWPEASRTAYVLPIAKPGQDVPYGALVVGLSPRLMFDDAYASFFKLASQHIASAIANAVAYEDERRRAAALAEIDRAKTTFFSNVSHEFRTPLTLMLAPIEDMRALPARDDDERERIELLHRNSLRLLKLVNTLLDFSRIEAGRVEAVYEPTDLAVLTADLASSFRSAVERAGLALVVDCQPLSEPIYVDHAMWEKVVLNLLSNAFKFTFEGSISVRLRAVDGGAELEIADTGIGIAEQNLPRLFERFHRVEGARSRSHEGSGIGLALVHELIRQHGGEIFARSREGEGTTFSVRIPAGVAHLPQDRIRAQLDRRSNSSEANPYVEEASRWSSASDDADSMPPAREAARATPRARIIVADDNADMRGYVTRLLREYWEVDAVSDGQEALDAMRSHPPDLVLSDVMMPGLDGFALLRAVRSDALLRATPIVLLSARAGEEATAEGLGAGADDYIVKPFSARELLVRVSARLAASRGAREVDEQRKRLYRHFMEAPFTVAVLRGPELVVELANDVMLKAWGKGPEVFGLPFRHAAPEIVARQPFAALLEGVYRTGVPYHGRGELARVPTGPDGALEDTYWNFEFVPLSDAHGAPEGVMVCGFDVTEQVAARQQVEKARAEAEALAAKLSVTAAAERHARESAEEATRLKDEFLATLSHELRTPLNAILGWSRMIQSGGVTDDKRVRGIDTIVRNALAQHQLIEDLLDVSRIIAGKMRLNVDMIDVSLVVSAAIDVVQPGADAKGVRVQAVLDPDAGLVSGDAARLQQIAWNLLTNAVKFTARGGRVHVSLRREESFVELTVADTGEGIAPEFLPYVFDRFRQQDGATTRKAGGLGLGLAIVKNLVELHGGRVEVASDGEGKGSTFVVRIPIAPVRSIPNSAPARDDRAPAPRDRLQVKCPEEIAGLKILVVDDEEDSRDLLRLVLEECAGVVTTVGSVAEALAIVGRLKPDVIVSDIGMPGEDGYSFIKKLRARAREEGGRIPAVALTAYARPEDRTRALVEGFQSHAAKPVDPQELLVVVANLAGRYS